MAKLAEIKVARLSWLKLTALLTAFTFLTTTVTSAQILPQPLAAPKLSTVVALPDRFTVPDELGSIQEEYRAPGSNSLIVHSV